MANQGVKQYYAWKAEDHEIKDCKKRRNNMLRYTGSRYKRNEREDGAVWDNK